MENCDGVKVCRANVNHNTLVELGIVEEASSLGNEHQGIEGVVNEDGLLCGPVTIRVNRRNGMPIRLGTRKVCVRQITNGEVQESYICRTVVREMTVEELECGISDGVLSRCIKVSRIGMFRNRLKLIMKDGEPAETNEEMEVMEFRVKARQGINGGSARRLRESMQMEGSITRSGRVQKRRSRRRIGRVEDFQMFDRNGGIIDRRGNGRRMANTAIALTEEQKFENSMKEAIRCTENLDLTWNATPYFRCSGVRKRNQKFVAVSTFRTKRRKESGGSTTTVIVSVVIEEESKRVRDVNFKRTRSEDTDDGGEVRDEDVIFCSCDVVWQNSGIGKSSCWHVESMLREPAFMSKVNSILENGFIEENMNYFGQMVLQSEMDNGPTRFSIVDGDSRAERPIDDDEVNCSVIAIQLDTLTAEELTAKGNRIGKRWSAWKVIDIREGIMTTVLWRPLGNGRRETSMTCVMCRTSRARKCKHELQCERRSQNIEQHGNLSSDEYERDDLNDDVGDMDVEINTGSGTTAVNGASAEQNAEINVDERNDDGTLDGIRNGVQSRNGRRGEGQQVPGGNGDPEDPGPGLEPALPPFHRKAVNNTKEFYPTNIKRSFMLCEREKKIAEKLTDALEEELARDGCLLFCDPVGTQCGGIYVDSAGSHQRCDFITEVCKQGEPRKVTIFTLNHGAFSAVMLDWRCHRCGFHNKYRGHTHGLFPAAYGVAYTVELMYWYMHEMCYSTNSFRAVYATTTKLHYTPSYDRKFTTNRVNILHGTHKGNRRTANDAIRKFIEQIDVDAESATEKLYSCPTCEVQMEDTDFTQLGLDAERFRGAKRLKGIVIDAKVVPLLKEGTMEDDTHDVLQSVSGLNTRIISNRDRQNALRLFLKCVKWAMNQRRNQSFRSAASGHDVSDSQSTADYMYTNGLFYIRAGCMERQASTKSQRERAKLVQYIKIIRHYIDSRCCLCGGSERSSVPNHDGCVELRQLLRGTGGREAVSAVMSALFRNVEYQNPPAQSGEQSSTANLGPDDAWIAMRFSDFASYEDQMDSILELVSLTFVEPVTLGFLPFHTEEGNDQSYENRTTVSVDGTSLGIPVENVSGMDIAADGVTTSDRMDQVLRAIVNGLANESVRLHEKISTALETFSSCVHGTVRRTNWPCELCVDGLNSDYRAIALQNATVGKYVRDVTRHGRGNALFSRGIANIVAGMLTVRIRHLKKYLLKLSTSMHSSSLGYWRKFGHCSVRPLGSSRITTPNTLGALQQEVNSFRNSLYVFPGRSRVRNAIQFDKLDRQDCSKNYFKGNSQIPSFMTVQCSCGHPKLLGFVILKQCESISAALSSILTNFAIPPRRIWYDNACNTYDSALTRIPWYLRWTKLVVDRFHYTGHTCSNAFNGNLHRLLDDDRSVAAEVINAIIDKCSRHISYLEGNNVIPFMKVLFAHLNACSHIRDHLKRSDIEDDDVWKLFRELYSCACDSCVNGSDDPFGREGDGVSVFTRHNALSDIALALDNAAEGPGHESNDNGDDQST